MELFSQNKSITVLKMCNIPNKIPNNIPNNIPNKTDFIILFVKVMDLGDPLIMYLFTQVS